jgi:ketosteroid isomerase-like protein
MDIQTLEQYGQAWNDHDIDAIMALMTADCTFDNSGGSERHGTRFQGQQAVRSQFIELLADLPDVHFAYLTDFIEGCNGCSEWTFTATTKSGHKIEVNGCDLFTFENGKIKSKRTYMKNRN